MHFFSRLLRASLWSLYLIGIHGSLTLGQERAASQYLIRIQEKTDPITLDGEILEESWAEASLITGFQMSRPFDDRRAILQTEVRVCYDLQYLYISVVCHGSYPFIVQSLKRDSRFWDGDGFAVVLDPAHQKTNGFLFGINPLGVQTDGLISRGGRDIDKSWNAGWQSTVKKFPHKWQAEIAIPFNILQFDPHNLDWGVNFIRNERRKDAFHTWKPVPRQHKLYDLTYTGQLLWDSVPQGASHQIGIQPYLAGSSFVNYRKNEFPLINWRTGIDATASLNAAMQVDLAINPDFSQADVDDQIINLTRFNIRLPERRRFFIENSDLFNDFSSSAARPFFSRRIGLDEKGRPVPVLYAAKLTGHLKENQRIGALNVQTQATEDAAADNFSALVFHQKVLKRSVIKGFLLNRQTLKDTYYHFKPAYGRNAGIEFDYLSDNNQWSANGAYNHAFKKNISQLNYYYKIGGQFRNRNFHAFINWYEIKDNYTLDMGFLENIKIYDAESDTTYRIGFASFYQQANYHIYPDKNRNITSIDLEANNKWVYRSSTKEVLERHTSLSARLRLPGNQYVDLTYKHDQVNLIFPFSFFEGELLPAGSYITQNFVLDYQSDERNDWFLHIKTQYGGFYNGNRWRNKSLIRYRVQPWGTFGLELDYHDFDMGPAFGRKNLLAFTIKSDISFSNKIHWGTFVRYSSQSENLNLFSRLQWQFAPLSDIFIVYSHNHQVDTDTHGWDLEKFSIQPTSRMLILKVAYWLNMR